MNQALALQILKADSPDEAPDLFDAHLFTLKQKILATPLSTALLKPFAKRSEQACDLSSAIDLSFPIEPLPPQKKLRAEELLDFMRSYETSISQVKLYIANVRNPQNLANAVQELSTCVATYESFILTVGQPLAWTLSDAPPATKEVRDSSEIIRECHMLMDDGQISEIKQLPHHKNLDKFVSRLPAFKHEWNRLKGLEERKRLQA